MNGWYRQILDLVFPRHCVGCDILMSDDSESHICPHCLKEISFSNHFACAFCMAPVVGGKTCPFCIREHFLDRLLVTTSYENPLVKRMLKNMKYRFVKSLAGSTAELMLRYLLKRQKAGLELVPETTLIVPVPLTRRRLNWRGFNQSEIIAHDLSQGLTWPIAKDILIRVRNVKPQASMPDRVSRIENMKKVFSLNPNPKHTNHDLIKEKSILLIDDISTTGSTLDDCARALKSAGAKEVIAFVFARNN
jgi:competence protein ComFC